MTYKSCQAIPTVMSFSAHDPSGGSGIQADIEAILAMGGHCVPIITTIKTQNTTGINQYFHCSSKLVHDQAKTILEDIPVTAFKIGYLGSIENIRAVHQILISYPQIPVVLDPALQLDANISTQQTLLEALIALILPHTFICTVNAIEAKLMAQEADTIDACAQSIMAHGVNFTLITESQNLPCKWTNTFYGNYRRLETFTWDRLEHDYHGAGCTLSACIAALLAQGLSAQSATLQAQEYTSECLKNGFRIGMGRQIPNRLFWGRGTPYEYDFKQEKHQENVFNVRGKK